MKPKPELREQFKKISFIVIKVLFIYLIVTLLIIGIGKLVYNIPIGYFTRDANWTLHGPFYIGSISNLGAILWTAAATLCFLSYA